MVYCFGIGVHIKQTRWFYFPTTRDLSPVIRFGPIKRIVNGLKQANSAMAVKTKNTDKKKNNKHLLYLLGIRLIALSGLSTRIVRMAEKFMFSTFKQYSRALKNDTKRRIYRG